MGAFDTAAAATNSAFYNTFGEAVTYARSGQTSLSITAIRSEANASGVDAGGVMVGVVGLDFLIKVAELTYGDPARGDTITDAAGRVYDVQADGAEKITETSEWRLPVVEVL
jgi:hypothetical protein